MREQPKVFIPRLITTTLYTIYALYSISFAADLYLNQSNPIYLQENIGRLAIILAASVALYAIDIFSYAMYPQIVDDYTKRAPISLRKAVSSALKAWPTLLAVAAVVLFLTIIVASITSLLEVLYLISDNVLYLVASAILALAILIAFAIVMFFAVPIAVLDGSGAIESFKKSFTLGVQYKKELLGLNLFFTLLVLATLTLVGFMEFEGGFSLAAAVLFVSTRALQAVIYTYITVTNPYIYLSVRKVNKSAT